MTTDNVPQSLLENTVVQMERLSRIRDTRNRISHRFPFPSRVLCADFGHGEIEEYWDRLIRRDKSLIRNHPVPDSDDEEKLELSQALWMVGSAVVAVEDTDPEGEYSVSTLFIRAAMVSTLRASISFLAGEPEHGMMLLAEAWALLAGEVERRGWDLDEIIGIELSRVEAKYGGLDDVSDES